MLLAHDNNSYKWCSNGKINLMINPNPGNAVLSTPSRGAQVTAGKFYFTGFCNRRSENDVIRHELSYCCKKNKGLNSCVDRIVNKVELLK